VTLKRLGYLLFRSAVRCWWTLEGGRHMTVMGQPLVFHPRTSVPSHRHMRLPRGPSRSRIVRYADFVQMHACCWYCESLERSARPFIVDVGAHHGAYAVVLGNLISEKGGRVLAIEPDPDNANILRWNIRRNNLSDRVVVEQVACPETVGTRRLVQMGDQSFLVPDQPAGPARRGVETSRARTKEKAIEVSVTTLRELLVWKYGAPRVDLLIIDVEGAELAVLRGFPWGQIQVGRIFCELHRNEWHKFGYGPEEFAEFLRARELRSLDMYFQEYDLVPTERYIGPCCLVPATESAEGSRRIATKR